MVKIIPISKEYRENWGRIFSRGSSNDRASVCSGDDAGSIPAPGSYEPYGAVGILGYPGWCVPVDMRRDNL